MFFSSRPFVMYHISKNKRTSKSKARVYCMTYLGSATERDTQERWCHEECSGAEKCIRSLKMTQDPCSRNYCITFAKGLQFLLTFSTILSCLQKECSCFSHVYLLQHSFVGAAPLYQFWLLSVTLTHCLPSRPRSCRSWERRCVRSQLRPREGTPKTRYYDCNRTHREGKTSEARTRIWKKESVHEGTR